MRKIGPYNQATNGNYSGSGYKSYSSIYNKTMYRYDHENKHKLSSQITFTEFGTPTYGTSKNKYLEKKVSFKEHQKHQFLKEKDKTRYPDGRATITGSTSLTPEPLSFSGNMIHKKKKSCSKDITMRSRQSQSSKSSKSSYINFTTSTPTKFLNSRYEKLRQQNEKLRSQNKTLLINLVEAKNTVEGISKMFTSKCQETETLKSIISSLKHYIHQQKVGQIENQVYSRYEIYQEKNCAKQTQKHQRKISQKKQQRADLFKRISINQALAHSPYYLNVTKPNDIKAFDSYIREQCVESIKGSAYEIFQSTQLF